jgi:hypothetical protein
MKAMWIDTSEKWVGIIVGRESKIRILNFLLKREFGKPIHMRELKLGEKLRALGAFDKLFAHSGGKFYSLRSDSSISWIELIRWAIRKGITTLYVDFEINEELQRRVPRFYLKTLDVYANKEDTQCVDILSYGDSHHELIRYIWRNVSIIRRGPLVE